MNLSPRFRRCLAVLAAALGMLSTSSCSTPAARPANHDVTRLYEAEPSIDSRESDRTSTSSPRSLDVESSLTDYIAFAVRNNPKIQAAHYRWQAAAARIEHVGVLPDPQLMFGYFLEEVQTRTGPQDARVGLRQTVPWPSVLGAREDVAARSARAAWFRFEAERIAVAERVIGALHELRFLDRSLQITRANLALLISFEEVVRARYRVGDSSHPSLVRVQLELGHLEDRVAELESLRPTYVADLNTILHRASSTEMATTPSLPGRVASGDVAALIDLARASNPRLLSLDEEIESARADESVARLAGYPDFVVGLDYIFTDHAVNSGTRGSGDDPVLLTLGVSIPLARGKYSAREREARARRLAIAHDRSGHVDQLEQVIHRAWFEHHDADRRERLYSDTLVPRAEEAVRVTLAAFRTGDSSFLDLIDSERTLLEFAVAAERARADRARALARLMTAVGRPVPTRLVDVASPSDREGEER